MALGAGLEPATYRLTADCSTIEPPQNIFMVGGEGFEPPMFTLWERIYSPLQHHHHCRPPVFAGALYKNRTCVGRIPIACSATKLTGHLLEPRMRVELISGDYESPVLPLN